MITEKQKKQIEKIENITDMKRLLLEIETCNRWKDNYRSHDDGLFQSKLIEVLLDIENKLELIAETIDRKGNKK